MMKYFQDFRDRRAAVINSEHTWLDVLTTGAGGIAAALPLVSKVGEWLGQIPYLWPVVNAGLPLLACAALPYVVCSTVVLAPAETGVFSSFGGHSRRYQFSRARRQTAKALLLPVAALTVYQVAQSMPNVLVGRKAVSGYVCSLQDGNPLSGSVEILDASGVPASLQPEILDRSGFFHSKLRSWGFRAVTARLVGSPCFSGKLALPVDSEDHPGCPGDRFAIRQPVSTRMLFVSCDNKEKK